MTNHRRLEGQDQMSYYYKTVDGARSVYRIEGETLTHVTVSNPMFKCWGSIFSRWGRGRLITKRWLTSNKFKAMPAKMAARYDRLQQGDSPSTLF